MQHFFIHNVGFFFYIYICQLQENYIIRYWELNIYELYILWVYSIDLIVYLIRIFNFVNQWNIFCLSLCSGGWGRNHWWNKAFLECGNEKWFWNVTEWEWWAGKLWRYDCFILVFKCLILKIIYVLYTYTFFLYTFLNWALSAS